MLLHCNGVMEEMAEVGANAVLFSANTARRAKAALRFRRKPLRFDEKQALGDLAAVMAS